ncbi:MAG: NAD(P)/FAD-dependent oxidoreductase [Bacteroidia bacterium]
MKTSSTDVLVIGAGPAGSIAASIVRQAGYNVRVVEKLKFPRFVIGESLLPRCMEALEEAKFLEAVKAKGFQEKFGAKFVRDGEICDFNFSSQYTPGWNWTWQVPRGEFDKTLADTLETMGVPVNYETTVTAIRFDGTDSVTTVEDKDGNKEEIQARFIIDGSGYGRVIPSLFNLDRPSSLPSRKTLFTHMEDTRRSMAHEPNRITIVVHKPAIWIWVIPFSNGVTSVGFVGEPEFFDSVSGTPEEMLRALIASEPEIAERFADSKMMFPPMTLQSWSKTTDKFYGDGFVLTGNVTEFLDPVFSSGVTLASVSSQLAAHMVIRTLNGEKVDWQKEYQEKMQQGVDTFRTYVNGWYDGTLHKVFFAEQKEEQFMNQICSVLAEYVWDESNPFVRQHEKMLKTLVKVIEINEPAKS